MRKLVHLLKRQEGIEVPDFQEEMLRLRQEDPALPADVAYCQSHTLLKGYGRGDLLSDVVEEFTFPSAETCTAFRASPVYAALWERRLPIIEGARSIILPVVAHLVKAEPVPENAVKNIEYVTCRAGMALEPFQRHWREVHGPLGASIPSVLRYEQYHSAPEAYVPGQPPRYDGLAVTWFESTQAMRDGAETEAYRITREDEPCFLHGHLPIIITREVLKQ